ncbi:MAG: glycosyltransferase family 2 protein [Chitinophagales bacterium]
MVQALFWLAVLALVHSYVCYPLLLRYWARGKTLNQVVYTPTERQESADAMPYIAVLMAIYNEEKVLEAKLKSMVASNYPLHRLEFLIGSDNSTDKSHQIIFHFQEKYPDIKLNLRIFEGRNGKINIINALMEKHHNRLNQYPNGLLVLTDANVLFSPNLFFELSKHFKNPRIGLVGANILNVGVKNAGISYQEKWYIQHENGVKYHEGIIWGHMMGAFGACYAMRTKLFEAVPNNFIVDDFFQTFKVLEKGYEAIKAPLAICYEDVSDDIFEEYRRKKRISAGNFQNLHAFRAFLSPFQGSLAFSFWSHKVLRWLGPVFLLLALVTNGFLAGQNYFYQLTLFVQIGLIGLALLDTLLHTLGIHFKLSRFVRYFYLMNLALAIGLTHYLRGVKTNVWKPTKREEAQE